MGVGKGGGVLICVKEMMDYSLHGVKVLRTVTHTPPPPFRLYCLLGEKMCSPPFLTLSWPVRSLLRVQGSPLPPPLASPPSMRKMEESCRGGRRPTRTGLQESFLESLEERWKRALAVACEISNEKAKKRSEWLWLPPTAFPEYSNNRTKRI